MKIGSGILFPMYNKDPVFFGWLMAHASVVKLGCHGLDRSVVFINAINGFNTLHSPLSINEWHVDSGLLNLVHEFNIVATQKTEI